MLSFDGKPMNNYCCFEDTYHICNFLGQQLGGKQPESVDALKQRLEKGMLPVQGHVTFSTPKEALAEPGDLFVLVRGEKIQWAVLVVQDSTQ